MKYSQEEIEEWKERIRKSKRLGQKQWQFGREYNMVGGKWQDLKAQINDLDLTSWEKGKTGPKGPRRRAGQDLEELGLKRTTYHAVPIAEVEEKPKLSSKPVFCLIVAFDSKEEALKAMGAHL